MSSVRSPCEDLALAFDPGATVLLRAPTLESTAQCICPHINDGSDGNLLVVSLSGNPDRRLDAWRQNGGLPGKVAVVSVDGTRSAAVTSGSVSRSPDGAVISTTTVSEPGDLTGISIKLNQCLSAWEDERTTICFDSLTTLLQYVDTERVFRYLNVMAKRIRNVGATAHYHIDPAAHDPHTLATIENAFSEVLEYDPDEKTWSRA